MLSTFMEIASQPFVLSENIGRVLAMAVTSMIPTYEGRYAVITGITVIGLPVWIAYAMAVVCSTVPMPFILLLLRPILDWFYTLPIPPVRKFAAWIEKRSEKKRQKMHSDSGSGLMGRLGKRVSAETLELIGLFVFVAVPLPGTGVWTGSAIATLFEMPRGKSAVAIVLGNIIACLITTLVTIGGKSMFG